jgi:hypothetical protein
MFSVSPLALAVHWGRYQSIGMAIQGLGRFSSNPPWGLGMNQCHCLTANPIFLCGGDLINDMDVP